MRKCLIAVSLLSAILFFLVVNSAYSEEKLTISTYYPSPYGSYKDLSVSNTLYVRKDTVPSTNDVGIWAVSSTTIAPGKTANLAVYAYNEAVAGAMVESWGNSTAGIVGVGPTGGAATNQWAGYFVGDVFISGALKGGVCTRIHFSAFTGVQWCPSGTYITSNPFALPGPPGGPPDGFFLCCPCAGCP